jgi:hypothetical protein
MSAFMVDAGHIDYMVSAVRHAQIETAYVKDAAEAYGMRAIELNRMTDTELGELLCGTNLASMRARYGERLSDEEMALPAQYRYHPVPAVQPLTLLKAVQCYEYQSCEFDAFPDSIAADICRRLTAWGISHLPGYAEAPGWGLTRK